MFNNAKLVPFCFDKCMENCDVFLFISFYILLYCILLYWGFTLDGLVFSNCNLQKLMTLSPNLYHFYDYNIIGSSSSFFSEYIHSCIKRDNLSGNWCSVCFGFLFTSDRPKKCEQISFKGCCKTFFTGGRSNIVLPENCCQHAKY